MEDNNSTGITNSENTEGVESIRDEKGRIKPGNTLNPGGRPRKKKLADYYSDEEIESLILRIKQEALSKGDIMKLVTEQIFGKAPQTMDVTSNGNTIFQITPEIATKNGINDNSTSCSERDSE